MSNELLPEHFGLLKQIASNEGFGDFDVDINAGSIKGDNYLGIIKLVNVTDKATKKTLHLVGKFAQTHEKFRESTPIDLAYQREAFIYNNVLPAITEIQLKHNIRNPFTNFAKLYGTFLENANECIFLGNLKEQGYKLYNRKEPINASHVTLVLKAYARFHAACLALGNLKSENYKKLTKPLVGTIFDEKLAQMGDAWLDSSKTQIQAAIDMVEDFPKAKLCLEKFKDQMEAFFVNDLRDEKYQLVITHGDCWCNNFLFKYEDSENSKNPTDVRILDWQIAMMGSPVLDIAYFLCAGCVKEELNKIDHYLDLYHESLSENIAGFGLDPNKVFSRATLDEHWKKFAKYGLHLAIVILRFVVGDSDEAPDFEKMAEDGSGDILEGLRNHTSRNDHLYKARLVDVTTFMLDRGLV